MDAELVLAVPRVQNRRRGSWRVQRQVHGQPIRPARRVVRNVQRPYPRHLPQLFSGRRPLAVHGRTPGEGCVNNVSLHDLAAASRASREEVLRGLRSPQKELPCELLYDEIGSQLFEQICDLDEYYPTRAELRIMRASAAQMAARIGPDLVLIEYCSRRNTERAV